MSSIVLPNVKSELLEIRAKIDALLEQVGASAGEIASAAPSKGGKKSAAEKKPKRASQGTAWAAYSSQLIKTQEVAYKAFQEQLKQAGGDDKRALVGVMPKFAKHWRAEHEEEYAAFEAEWRAAHPPLSSKASVASDDAESVAEGEASEGSEKKKRGPKKLADMTPEEKAKHDAGVAARKAKKAAEKAAGGEEEVPLAPAAAPAKPAAAPAAPVVAEEAEEAEEGDAELLPFKLDTVKYLRLGTQGENGTISWLMGDLWENNKGSKGEYKGCLLADGTIDYDAVEPELN